MALSVTPAISSSANQVYFKGPYLCQNWSLPDSIIYYLAKNPKSPKCYQKLIQSCKYYFSKNPIIVSSHLTFSGEENESEIEIEIKHDRKIALKDFSQSFWITGFISIFAEGTGQRNVMSSVIPNIYQCDIKELCLGNQIVSLNELFILASKADDIFLKKCTVTHKDGSVISVEKIIETFDQAKTFEIDFNENDSSISAKTVENLIKIPHFSSIDKICLYQISDAFDIETFYGYMKKNKHTLFCLIFDDTISDAYENRLEEIVDEIIETENHDYKPPFIDFDGLSLEQCRKLWSIAI